MINNDLLYMIPAAPTIHDGYLVQQGYIVLRFQHEGFPTSDAEPVVILAFQRLSMQNLGKYVAFPTPLILEPRSNPLTNSLAPPCPLPTPDPLVESPIKQDPSEPMWLEPQTSPPKVLLSYDDPSGTPQSQWIAVPRETTQDWESFFKEPVTPSTKSPDNHHLEDTLSEFLTFQKNL
jgi:hypothetical protein